MYMSVTTDGDMTDYSDYRTQMAIVELPVEVETAGDQDGRVSFSIEPLSSVGGLSNNEVAELVYLETEVAVEIEDDEADQDVGTVIEHRGAVGVNLPASDSGGFVRNTSTPSPERTVIDEPQDASYALATSSSTVSDNKFLQQYMTYTGPPFDDETNGLGGGFSGQPRTYEKSFRATHNRGPVLDQNDDIVVNMGFSAGDILSDFELIVRLTMYWDVAETSDAGRQFSVPT
jgi:hypothetical protein